MPVENSSLASFDTTPTHIFSGTELHALGERIALLRAQIPAATYELW